MNRFEEMNVTEQQEIGGGGVSLPIIPTGPVKLLITKVVTVGAVAGGAAIALNVISGK